MRRGVRWGLMMAAYAWQWVLKTLMILCETWIRHWHIKRVCKKFCVRMVFSAEKNHPHTKFFTAIVLNYLVCLIYLPGIISAASPPSAGDMTLSMSALGLTIRVSITERTPGICL